MTDDRPRSGPQLSSVNPKLNSNRHNPPPNPAQMPAKDIDFMDVDSDSDISLPAEETSRSKGKGKGKAVAKSKKTKGKGKANEVS